MTNAHQVKLNSSRIDPEGFSGIARKESKKVKQYQDREEEEKEKEKEKEKEDLVGLVNGEEGLLNRSLEKKTQAIQEEFDALMN